VLAQLGDEQSASAGDRDARAGVEAERHPAGEPSRPQLDRLVAQPRAHETGGAIDLEFERQRQRRAADDERILRPSIVARARSPSSARPTRMPPSLKRAPAGRVV
jgi:hypothetical protein